MKILVCGAGIAGLAFVRAMQATFPCHLDIVERAEVFNIVGSGISIFPNGLGALQKIGLAEQVQRVGMLLETLNLAFDGDSIRIQMRDVWRNSHLTSVTIGRRELHQILFDSIKLSENTLTFRMGIGITAIRQDLDSVWVQYSSGEASRYDLIVGADGVNSTLRRLLIPDAKPEGTGLHFFRFLADNSFDYPNGVWTVGGQHPESFGIYAVSEGQVHAHVMVRSPTQPCEVGNEVEFITRRSDGWHPLIAKAIAARTSPVHISQGKILRPAVWGFGRCVLIGDAAHAISPNFTQGASLAMEDAVLLAQQIRLHGNLQDSISSFVSIREPAISWALRMATSQVNTLRRSTSIAPINPEYTLAYMQQMYAPLKLWADEFARN